MKEDGSPILAKNTSGTLTFRNQADDADLGMGNTAPPVSGKIDYTATRVPGTVYQNTGAKPIFVSISLHDTVGRRVNVYAGANNPPTAIIQTFITSSANPAYAFFIVLPGEYFKIASTLGTPTIDNWIEWS